MTIENAIKLEEDFLCSELVWEWRNNFGEDKPVCLKIGLKNKKNDSIK